MAASSPTYTSTRGLQGVDERCSSASSPVVDRSRGIAALGTFEQASQVDV